MKCSRHIVIAAMVLMVSSGLASAHGFHPSVGEAEHGVFHLSLTLWGLLALAGVALLSVRSAQRPKGS